MRFPGIVIIALIIMSLPLTGLSQDSAKGNPKSILRIFKNYPQKKLNNDSLFYTNKWADSIKKSFSIEKIDALSKRSIKLDSISNNDFQKLFNTDSFRVLDRLHLNYQRIPVNKPFLQFRGGSIAYNWNYRSTIDTPFKESNISQHFLSSRMEVTIADFVPVSFSYFERQSNSLYFRDYRDFRIEFNVQEFQRIRNTKLQRFTDQLTEQIRNPYTKQSLDFSAKQLNKLDDWLNQSSVVTQLINSRIAVLNEELFDSVLNSKDSLLQASKDFIKFYDEMKSKKEHLGSIRDSLQKEFIHQEKQIIAIKKIVQGGLPDDQKQEALEKLIRKNGLNNSEVKKIFGMLSSVQSFGIGKVLPNYSDLTLKNINVNGINFEYNRKLYFAISAGAIDYRTRDFFNSGKNKKPQFVYISRIGYGKKYGSHFYITAFKGKKQLLSSRENSSSLDIYGLSFESQLVVNNNHRILAEIAQSATPNWIASNNVNEKPSFKFKDDKNKAWSVKLNSFLPKSKTRIEAYYRYRGINFQSFSSYYSNATLNSWQVKADQYFIKRQLRINVAIARNNFENSQMPVVYNGRSAFKTANIYFRKNKWPSLSFGYMPSSQLSVISGQVYENYYHLLNFSSSHNYKLGLARAFSVITYNQFYNDSKDSGFIYFNARNIYFSQHFEFPSYGANLNIARTASRDYTLIILDAGARLKFMKTSSIGFGAKINQLNGQSVKVGLYGNQKISISKVGELNVWIEKNYLPGWKGSLIKTEFYNIGFTRFFK